jgi:hypothetical protein
MAHTTKWDTTTTTTATAHQLARKRRTCRKRRSSSQNGGTRRRSSSSQNGGTRRRRRPLYIKNGGGSGGGSRVNNANANRNLTAEEQVALQQKTVRQQEQQHAALQQWEAACDDCTTNQSECEVHTCNVFDCETRLKYTDSRGLCDRHASTRCSKCGTKNANLFSKTNGAFCHTCWKTEECYNDDKCQNHRDCDKGKHLFRELTIPTGTGDVAVCQDCFDESYLRVMCSLDGAWLHVNSYGKKWCKHENDGVHSNIETAIKLAMKERSSDVLSVKDRRIHIFSNRTTGGLAAGEYSVTNVNRGRLGTSTTFDLYANGTTFKNVYLKKRLDEKGYSFYFKDDV